MEKMDIQTFMATNPPKVKKSLLHKHRTEISRLRSADYSYPQITEWLNTIGMKVNINQVRYYCYRYIENKPYTKPSSSTKKKTKKG